MPAHHGGQADDDGQNPANGNNALCPFACHQAVVPGEERDKRHKTAAEPRRVTVTSIMFYFFYFFPATLVEVQKSKIDFGEQRWKAVLHPCSQRTNKVFK